MTALLLSLTAFIRTASALPLPGLEEPVLKCPTRVATHYFQHRGLDITDYFPPGNVNTMIRWLFEDRQVLIEHSFTQFSQYQLTGTYFKTSPQKQLAWMECVYSRLADNDPGTLKFYFAPGTPFAVTGKTVGQLPANRLVCVKTIDLLTGESGCAKQPAVKPDFAYIRNRIINLSGLDMWLELSQQDANRIRIPGNSSVPLAIFGDFELRMVAGQKSVNISDLCSSSGNSRIRLEPGQPAAMELFGYLTSADSWEIGCKTVQVDNLLQYNTFFDDHVLFTIFFNRHPAFRFLNPFFTRESLFSGFPNPGTSYRKPESTFSGRTFNYHDNGSFNTYSDNHSKRYSGQSSDSFTGGSSDSHSKGPSGGSSSNSHKDNPPPENASPRHELDKAYRELGLTPGSNMKEVKQRYRKLARESHPDKGGNKDDFIRYTTAYDKIRESWKQ